MDELPQPKKIRNLADWKDVKKTIKETKLETLGSTAQEAQLKTPEGACTRRTAAAQWIGDVEVNAPNVGSFCI